MGRPDLTEMFDIYNIDGFDVYVEKGIKQHRTGIRVYYKHYLWVKALAVDGVYLGY